jgi:hypothetical protein
MKVDIITKESFLEYQKTIMIMLGDMQKKIKTIENMIMQLQDRIVMLERGEKDV